MLDQPHLWNRDPLAARQYRLTFLDPRRTTPGPLIAVSERVPPLIGLANQLLRLGYDFVRLERVE